VKKLRADVWPSVQAHESEVGGVRVRFFKHPDVEVDEVEVIDVSVYWRDGVSYIVLCARRAEHELVLSGCNVGAEIRCSSSGLYSCVLDLLKQLGVSRETTLAVEVHLW
jgi:hypothetical protein